MMVDGFYVIGFDDERSLDCSGALFMNTRRDMAMHRNRSGPCIVESWGELKTADRYLLARDAVQDARKACERLNRKVSVWKVVVSAEKES